MNHEQESHFTATNGRLTDCLSMLITSPRNIVITNKYLFLESFRLVHLLFFSIAQLEVGYDYSQIGKATFLGVIAETFGDIFIPKIIGVVEKQ